MVVGGFRSFHVLVTTTNYNPLTTTPKDTVNNIILEAREINFPWNDVLDLTVKEWLECMVSSQRAQPEFFVGPRNL